MTKVIWICSPNNPTGNAFPRDAIEAVCAGFNGIVVVDEAYVDFSTKDRWRHNSTAIRT